MLGSLEIGAVVRMDFMWQSSSCHKTSYAGKESFSRKIRYDVQVGCLAAEAYEYCDVGFDQHWLVGVALFDDEGSSVVMVNGGLG